MTAVASTVTPDTQASDTPTPTNGEDEVILPPATLNEQAAQSKPLKSTADTLAIAAQALRQRHRRHR